MSLRKRLRTLFRLFLLLTVLMTAALISAITAIRLSIRGHQEMVPELVGLPLENAQRASTALGLELRVVDRLFSTQVPANSIVSQQPPAQTRVKVGQQIQVLVSLGPPKVVVPNLVGSTVRAAQIAAVQRGLTVGSVAAVYWPGAPADQVVAQDPPPQASNVQRPAVNFLVSRGEPPPTYVCPRFVGRPLAEARRTIERGRFKIGGVTPLPAADVPPGTILTQSPPSGSKIGPDAVFEFQVAQ